MLKAGVVPSCIDELDDMSSVGEIMYVVQGLVEQIFRRLVSAISREHVLAIDSDVI